MTPETIGAYIAAAGGILGPLALWAWKFIERKDKNTDNLSSRRIEQENSLFNRQDAQLDRAYKRIIELDLAISEIEKDRDRLAEVGWAWYTKCNHLNHDVMMLRLALPEGHPLLAVAQLPLPGYNDIVPPPRVPVLK
jgi:hypothetical protein